MVFGKADNSSKRQEVKSMPDVFWYLLLLITERFCHCCCKAERAGGIYRYGVSSVFPSTAGARN